MSHHINKNYKGLSIAAPFKMLELQLKLEDLEKNWELEKNKFIKAGDPEKTNELVKISLEKIRILVQINAITDEV